MKKILLKFREVSKIFESGPLIARNKVTAVASANFEAVEGETLGIIGESGSGKTTIGRIAAGLLEPSDGEVLIDGMRWRENRTVLRPKVQMIFQNPSGSFNPRMKIGTSLMEPSFIRRAGADDVSEMLESVGLPAEYTHKYPHELSGGECQRVAIARALSLKPDIIICDEVVSALDVIVRSQILNLLLNFQQKYNITYIFISHDLPVVRHMSDAVCVLQQGKIVESGPSESVFSSPQHQITQKLTAASKIS